MFRLLFILLAFIYPSISSGTSVPSVVISQDQLAGGAIPLSGLWAFDWKELHLDHDRPMNDGLMLPGLWHQQGPYEKEGYGTFRKSVILPSIQPYYLRVPDAPSAIALWVNGDLLYKRGIVAEQFNFERPKFGPEVVQLPAANRYDFVLHISNYHHKEGGMWHQLLLSDEYHKPTLSTQGKLLDAMLFMFLVTVAIYMLAIHWHRNNRKPALLFVLFLLPVALRSILVGERIAYDFLSLSWIVLQRLEHGLLWVALPIFIYYFHHFFKLNRYLSLRVMAHGVTAVSLLALSVVLFTEVKTFAYTGPVFQFMATASAIYCFMALVVLSLQKVQYSRQFLWGFLGFFVLFLHDILYTNLLIQSRPMAQFGLLFFVLMQSHMLWRARLKEGLLIRYVRNAIDHRTDNIKALITQEQKQKAYLHEEVFPKDGLSSDVMNKLKQLIDIREDKQAFPLSDLHVAIRPYFEILDCELQTKTCPRNMPGTTMIWVQKTWFEQVILCMGRLGETSGYQSTLVLAESEHHLLVRLSMWGMKPGKQMDSETLNWLIKILESMGCHLCLKRGKTATHVYFKYGLETQSQPPMESVKIMGEESGPCILIDTAKPEIYLESLAKLYRLVFAPLTVHQIKRYRPSLVLFENHTGVTTKERVCEPEIELIRQTYPSLPVLAVLPSHLKMELSQWIRKGISDYMVAPLVEEEVLLKVQSLLVRSVSIKDGESVATSDRKVDHPTVDLREITVQLVRTSIQYWQSYTGQSKADLAENSRLWRVYLDGSTAKTRTLDKYLSLQSLPKNPRWDTVSRTALFVMESCELSLEDRQTLDGQLKRLHQQLAS